MQVVEILEGVATPMTDASSATSPELDGYLAFLRRAGVAFRVADDLVKEPDHHGPPHANPAAQWELHLAGLPAICEHRAAAEGVSSDHASWSVARAMVRRSLVDRNSTFWDVGCGTGILGIYAAHLGASRVFATDVDPRALELARRSAAASGVTLDLRVGSLLDAVPAAESVDGIAANLPHKPRRPGDVLPLGQDGGDEGDTLWRSFAGAAHARLSPGGKVVFFLHSLPHPRLLGEMARHFHLTLESWKRRYLAPGEYGALADWYVERARAGTSYLVETSQGRALVAGVWIGTRR